MSTSRHAHLVYGIAVPRDHHAFDDLYPGEWLHNEHVKHVRSFGDAENSDDVLIGVALASVEDFSRGQDFVEVPSPTPDATALAELTRVIAAIGEYGQVTATNPRLFVCGESL